MAGLPGHQQLRETGVEFKTHYTASCACTPSRACLYTGHYPSLHGISQTYGGAKAADDPRLVWLQAGTFPTLGDYFRSAGYETLYFGKWHLSHEDLFEDDTGFVYQARDPATRERYQREDPLGKFGFTGWMGPDPHGPGIGNSGWQRDKGFANQFIEFLDARERRAASASSGEGQEGPLKPFLAVINLVNPHDIVHFPFWLNHGLPTTDGTVPDIDPPPTHREDLSTKPSTQLSYRRQYSKLFFPDLFQAQYRQLYYFLHKVVDAHIARIYTRLASSRWFSSTYTVLTSDHGDLLGAHGGLRQKWYNAYEESLHVPFIISHPNVRPGTFSLPTSSVDLIPTLLGLAGLDQAPLRDILRQTHSEVYPLVGANLSPLVLGSQEDEAWRDMAVYSQIEDHVTQGDVQVFIGARGKASLLLVHHFEHDSVEGPTSIEAVIQRVGGRLWKLVRYWDNPELWTHPSMKNEEVLREGHVRRGTLRVRTVPLPDELELYCLSDDPIESRNLAVDDSPETATVRTHLFRVLADEREKKGLRRQGEPLPKPPHKRLPEYQTNSQKEDSLRLSVVKILGFPDPDPKKPLPYSKI